MKKDRLGKGLGALIGDYLDPSTDTTGTGSADVRTLEVRAIVPNPLQPRQEFLEEELAELAASISENGLLQPLLVRPVRGKDDRFELVAGERRFRAVQRIGWDSVPVLVREMDDETLLVLALVENLQRSQLNAIEEAEGYQALADRFGLTQEQIARSVGKDRSTVTNLLRLLKLPVSIRKLLRDGTLSMGHARALLAIDDPVRQGDFARQAAAEGWSVRETERRVGEAGSTRKSAGTRAGAKGGRRDAAVAALEEALRERLATRVQIRLGSKGKGTIEIPFRDADDFDRVFAAVAGIDPSDVLG